MILCILVEFDTSRDVCSSGTYDIDIPAEIENRIATLLRILYK